MKVSVVIPVRNEAESIRELLDNLLGQTFVPAEIVITDGGSTDSTTEIIDEYIARGSQLKLIKAGPALPGRGRNLAAAAASYEWLAFIDGGIRPENDWLEMLVRAAQRDSTVDVVYGSWAPVIDSFFKECAAIAYVPVPAPYRPRFIASTLMRRAAWETAVGFPEDLRSAEDLVFMESVERRGFKAIFEPGALVHWNIRDSFGSTFQRFVTYARSNIQAGLWHQWQAAIMKRYALIILSGIPAFFLGFKWMLVPLLAWLAMLVGRAIVAIYRNRQCYPASPQRNLLRLTILIPLIATLDFAAFVGTLNWLLKDSFRVHRRTVLEAGDGT